MDSSTLGASRVNSTALSKNGVKYTLKIASQKLTLTLSAVAGGMFKGTTAANTQKGTANCDIFYGREGNDKIYGNNGRDVAVYDTKNWGKDTIYKTNGTMTILFNGIKNTQVTSSLNGTTMTITRKGVSNQSITIQGWNAATHNIVFGGTLSHFNKYVAAAKPTTAQTNNARNEVFKKASLA